MKLLIAVTLILCSFLILNLRSTTVNMHGLGISLDNQPIVQSFDVSQIIGLIVFAIFLIVILRKK